MDYRNEQARLCVLVSPSRLHAILQHYSTSLFQGLEHLSLPRPPALCLIKASERPELFKASLGCLPMDNKMCSRPANDADLGKAIYLDPQNFKMALVIALW